MKYFQICRRVLWGDYGNILLHGDLALSESNGRISAASLEACYPIEPAILPRGRLIVEENLMNQIVRAFPNVPFLKICVDRMVDINWRNFRVGKPTYPTGGDPINYLRYGKPIEADASYFMVLPSTAVEVYEDWPDGVWDVRYIGLLSYRLRMHTSREPFISGVLPNGVHVATYASSELLGLVSQFEWGQAVHFIEAM